MPKFTVLSNLKHDGEDYAPGAEIELSVAQARSLLEAGAIAAPPPKAAKEKEAKE